MQAAYNITFCDSNGTRKDRPNGGLYVNETQLCGTLTKGGVGTYMVGRGVRKPSPCECERLQGFPDGHTDVPWVKGGASLDKARFSALGNSMPVSVMSWIGFRISCFSRGRSS